MKYSKSAVVGLCLTFFPAWQACGDVLLYEGFDYPAGSYLDGADGGDGFNGSWTDNENIPSVMAASSLSYPGVATSGGSLIIKGSLEKRNIDVISPQNGSTTWISFLFSTSSEAISTGGMARLSVSPSNTASRLQIGVFDSGGKFYFGLQSAGTPVLSQTLFLSSVEFEPQKTYLIATSITWDTSGVAPETIRMYVNPALDGSTLGAPVVTRADMNIETNQNASGISRLDRMSIEAGGADWIFDEIRIASSFASAVPEPAACALILVGVVSLVGARRAGRNLER